MGLPQIGHESRRGAEIYEVMPTPASVETHNISVKEWVEGVITRKVTAICDANPTQERTSNHFLRYFLRC